VLLRDRDGVGDSIGIREGRAAELVDGYRGQRNSREAGDGKREAVTGDERRKRVILSRQAKDPQVPDRGPSVGTMRILRFAQDDDTALADSFLL
jgi:hypothetical protein